MKPSDYDKHRNIWRDWINRCTTITRELLEKNAVREEVLKAIKNSTLKLRSTHVYKWFERNSIIGEAVLIRCLTEPGEKHKSLSLRRLLTKIYKNPQVLSRDWFCKEYGKRYPDSHRDSWRKTAIEKYDEFVGEGEDTPKLLIQDDLEKLCEAYNKVGEPVSQYVVHLDKNPTAFPTIQLELFNRIGDEISDIIIRYNLILNQSSPEYLKPVNMQDIQTECRLIWST